MRNEGLGIRAWACLWHCLAILIGLLLLPDPTASLDGWNQGEQGRITDRLISDHELFRIRITNFAGGAVEVGRDNVYRQVGKVLRPATENIEGFPASAYLPDGVVAATAVHGIRIRVGERNGRPLNISIVPLQFATAPRGFGGHLPQRSGIYTDIPAGTVIFRGLSPFVGNPVRLQMSSGEKELPRPYRPAVGDIIIICVRVPDRLPKEVEIHNVRAGEAIARYQDGREEVFARVIRPVTGVGRFDGTSYTGVGAVNTNHPGVLTISTAPGDIALDIMEGEGAERRGGFQIQPSNHARTEPPMPQAMVIAPLSETDPPLECSPPLFGRCINLAWDKSDPIHSYRAEVRLDGRDWQPPPLAVGKLDNAFTGERFGSITHIRLIFPKWDDEWIEIQIAKAAQAYRAATLASRPEREVRGTIQVLPNLRDLGAFSYVLYFVDGNIAQISAAPPYEFIWNTEQAGNGPHLVDIRIIGADGSVIRTESLRYRVAN